MPSQNVVHQDKLLNSVSVSFAQDQSTFVAGRVFPSISVKHQSDKYLVVNRGDFNRDEMKKRAGGTESAGANFSYSDDNYFCDVWALHHDIDDQTDANAEEIFGLRQETTQFLTTKSLIRKEKLFVSNYFTTAVWSTDLTGVSGTPGAGQFKQWNDAASTPIEDIRAQQTAQQILTGFRPNVLVMGQQVYDKLIDHPDIIDRIKYGTTDDNVAIANKRTLARLFEVEEILVMGAVENTAVEGAAESNAFIGGKAALLVYRTRTPGKRTPTAGYTFSWTGLNNRYGNQGVNMKRFRMEELEAERLEIQMAFAMKVVAAEMGTFFASAVA